MTAVMIRTQYARYLPWVWITHSVHDSIHEAQLTALSVSEETTLVIYHSKEWERLVQ